MERADLDRRGFRDLRRKEAEIRLQLRTNGGHRGKVSQDMLIWLDDVERMKKTSIRTGDRAKFGREAKSLLESASSLFVSYGSNAIDSIAEQLASPTLVGKSAQLVLNQVCDYLADPEIGIIGLYGEGGVGKTTILKNLNNFLMNTGTFDKIIWVSLSQNADIQSVQNGIAVQLGITLPSWQDSSAIRRTRASLISDKLKNLGRCLVLLDDMWIDIWRCDDFKGPLLRSDLLISIGIPVQRPGSCCSCKVVLTTRSPEACKLIKAHMQIHVAPLSTHEAWDMFVGRSGDRVLDSEIQHIAKEIVYECKGLPITIITIAHAMREEVSTIAWRRALEDIRSTNDFDVDKRISDLLRFGYSHLKNEQVQKCFLYCAFFPEDFQFEARELIQYWIVEELICQESIVASIDEGYQILKEITDANMLEPVRRGGDAWVKMHDLFRDLAVSIMTHELGFLVQAGQHITLVHNLLANKKKASFIRNQISHLYLLESVYAPSDLSTLLLRENPLSLIYGGSFFNRHLNLQVLDMSYTGIIELPDSIYELSKLRVLFLQYCTSLEKLPSLEYCKKLQFLNLRGTLIKELPLGMEKLVQLRSLDLSETIRLGNIQEGFISSLSNLEELQMQGSLLCKLESPTIADCLKEIRCLKKLAILTLSAVGIGDHLDTILHLQGHSLAKFFINVYGSTQDYNEDV